MENILPRAMEPELIAKGWLSLNSAAKMINQTAGYFHYWYRRKPEDFKTVFIIQKTYFSRKENKEKIANMIFIHKDEAIEKAPAPIVDEQTEATDSFLSIMGIVGKPAEKAEARRVRVLY